MRFGKDSVFICPDTYCGPTLTRGSMGSGNVLLLFLVLF